MSVDSRSTRSRSILLTGRPGIGKTTVIMRLAESLQQLQVKGFYTEEIRESGRRKGFMAATFSGSARISAL